MKILFGFLVLGFLLCGVLVFFVPDWKVYIPDYVDGLGTFTGTFCGVLAGLAITYFLKEIDQRKAKKELIDMFILELELNKEEVEGWIESIEKYRNAVNGDALNNFTGYFKLSSFVGVAASQLHASGEAYKILSKEEFKQLQEAYNELSIGGEQFLNNQITENKVIFSNTIKNNNWQKNEKQIVVTQVDFWEQKFKTHLNTVNTIISRFKGHK